MKNDDDNSHDMNSNDNDNAANVPQTYTPASTRT